MTGHIPASASRHPVATAPAALTLNHGAALKSASWGIGQVMGANFRDVGFQSVDAMVAAMVESEDNQLAAMAGFIVAARLDGTLRQHDWTGFAAGYNGPDYTKNNYDGVLRQFYGHFATGRLPDLTVRAVQVWLTYWQLDPKGIDGSMGPGTATAIHNFQSKNRLAPTGSIDDALLAALSA